MGLGKLVKKVGKGVKNVAKGVAKGTKKVAKGVGKVTVGAVKVTAKGIKKAAPVLAVVGVAAITGGTAAAVIAGAKKGKDLVKKRANQALVKTTGIDSDGNFASDEEKAEANAAFKIKRKQNVQAAKDIDTPVNDVEKQSSLKTHTYASSKSPSSPRAVKAGREPTNAAPAVIETPSAPAAQSETKPAYQMAGVSPVMIVGLLGLAALAMRRK